MAEPSSVPACIKSLSNTTFVAEVTSPALAVLVPLLMRALNDRSMEVQRRTVVVIDNLVKLVRDPNIAAVYLSPLVEGVSKIAKGAAFPEVRAFGEAALQTLSKAGASTNAPPPKKRDLEGETKEAKDAIVALLPDELLEPSGATPKQPAEPLLKQTVEFEANLVADLVAQKKFADTKAWNRCVGAYTGPWLESKDGAAFAEELREHFHAIEKVRYFGRPFALCTDHVFFRPNTRPRRPTTLQKANFSVTPSSLLLTVLSSCSHTRA